MRAIPARVVCLLGMDHDAFPAAAARCSSTSPSPRAARATG